MVSKASKSAKAVQVQPEPVSIPEGVTTEVASPTTAETTNDAVESSGPAVVEHVSDAPELQMAPEANSTDEPESEAPVGGSGDPAAPAEGAAEAAIRRIEQALAQGDLDKADELLSKVEADFRASYPNFSVAVDAWQAAGHTAQPSAVRVVSRIEGFRRANIAHSKAPSEYPLESLKLPEQLEQLLGEPNLVVELI